MKCFIGKFVSSANRMSGKSFTEMKIKELFHHVRVRKNFENYALIGLVKESPEAGEIL